MYRFWSKVNITDLYSCWDWTGAISGNGGYGVFYYKNRNESAHRVAYITVNGKIPEGLCVMHTCDNPLCVNPAHLKLGTIKDNAIDRSKKKRFQIIHTEKLTNEQVIAIRILSQLEISIAELARMYHRDRKTIRNCINRLTYSRI